MKVKFFLDHRYFWVGYCLEFCNNYQYLRICLIPCICIQFEFARKFKFDAYVEKRSFLIDAIAIACGVCCSHLWDYRQKYFAFESEVPREHFVWLVSTWTNYICKIEDDIPF